MRIDIVTVFPEVVQALTGFSMLKRALDKGLVEINAVDLRTFSTDKHRKVDDYPYGGGAGMVLKPEPLFRAIEFLTAGKPAAEIIALTPGGKQFSQGTARDLSGKEHLVLLCGHYEGIDQRVLDGPVTMEVSIGDYILTGGELPALVITDAVTRLLPGVLGNEDSAMDESFESGLLEYPHYTRPQIFRGMEVPDILLSGHHAEIARWRRQKALEKTRVRRPELLSD
ncbi:MAG: tRNA (guanosine(37)-N1)-methyltransferase TrmD [Firmicutes bacterium]|nr:tRNA (guanosine(37)-N1)-methyltransferase TrmD [Bacillota bacterium]